MYFLCYLLYMDDGKDFRGQRPALVTSDATQWSPGNKSVFFFFDI